MTYAWNWGPDDQGNNEPLSTHKYYRLMHFWWYNEQWKHYPTISRSRTNKILTEEIKKVLKTKVMQTVDGIKALDNNKPCWCLAYGGFSNSSDTYSAGYVTMSKQMTIITCDFKFFENPNYNFNYQTIMTTIIVTIRVNNNGAQSSLMMFLSLPYTIWKWDLGWTFYPSNNILNFVPCRRHWDTTTFH